MKIIYVMHPFGGNRENLDKSEAWCAFLSSRFDALFVAPWVPLCLHWENNGISLDRGLTLDCVAIERCDGCVAVGGRWSPGMLHERTFADRVFADRVGKQVIDATQFRTPNDILADHEAMANLAKVYGTP